MFLKKTAGILGDDLAVNAEKATGFASAREIPVLLAITKGSFINKAAILPVVFLLSFFAPGVITSILLVGGVYCLPAQWLARWPCWQQKPFRESEAQRMVW